MPATMSVSIRSPIIAVALWVQAGGGTWLVGLYLAGAGVLTLIALALSRETKDSDYGAASVDDDEFAALAETESAAL